MARAMLLHLRLHWSDEFSPDLWPFALDYAVYIYNHVPCKGKSGAPSPIEFFCGAKVGCQPLRRLRVFGCPSYVLDSRLQDGKKILKWEPRSRQAQSIYKNIGSTYHDPQEVVPTTSRPSDSSRVLPDDQLFDDFNTQLQQASQDTSRQTQPSRSGSRVIEVEVSPSVTEQEEHNPEGVHQSPFRPRRST
eukprot:scaffold1662_cov147-Amphora_coffeaeformis.AAC.1